VAGSVAPEARRRAVAVSISAEELGPFLNEHDWTISDDQAELSDKCGIEFHGIAVK
jgi:hypothetical protein